MKFCPPNITKKNKNEEKYKHSLQAKKKKKVDIPIVVRKGYTLNIKGYLLACKNIKEKLIKSFSQ